MFTTATRTQIRKAATFAGVLLAILLTIAWPGYIPGRPSQFNFSRLKPGIDREKAEAIMGKPTTVGDIRDGEIWYEWYTGYESYSVQFKGRPKVLVAKHLARNHTPG